MTGHVVVFCRQFSPWQERWHAVRLADAQSAGVREGCIDRGLGWIDGRLRREDQSAQRVSVPAEWRCMSTKRARKTKC